MPIYYIVLDHRVFHEDIVPPLAASWRQRSFVPCRALCASLRPIVAGFRAQLYAGSEEPLLVQVERGLPFDLRVWRTLVGEVLLFAAAEVPELQTAPETLCCLLAPDQYRAGDVPRERFAPIQQAHFGSRELTFGAAVYRPEQVGLNDRDDVVRLAAYLAEVEPQSWSIAALAELRGVEDDERAEELEYVRDWFPALQDLYRQASERGRVVVCERF